MADQRENGNRGNEPSRKAENDLLGTMLDRLPDLMPESVLLIRERKLAFINEAGVKLFRARSAADLVGRPLSELVPPGHAEMVEKALDTLAGGQGIPRFERTFARRDGGSITVEVAMVPFADGEASAALVLVRDVTERNQKEASARLHLERLQALVQLSQMSESGTETVADFVLEKAVQLTQSEGAYLAFLNEDESMLTLFGWTKGQAAEGLARLPRIHPVQTNGIWLETVRRREPVLANEQMVGRVKGGLGDDAPPRRHVGIPVFEGERIVAVAGVMNKACDYDASDTHELMLLMDGMWKHLRQRRSEAALKTAQAHHKLLVETSPDCVYEIDKEGFYTYVNAKTAAMLGVTPDAMIGRRPEEFLGRPQVGWLQKVIRGILETGQPHFDAEPEEWIPGKVWMDTRMVPVENSHGDVVSVLGFGRDVTAQREAEAKRQRLEVQLRQAQKMEAIGTLAGGIAHDFNNLLGVIFGFTELACQELEAGSPAKENLGQVIKAAHRARDLVKQILAFSRQQEQLRQPVLLQPVVEDALKLLRATLPTTIEIVTALDAPRERVLADPSQIHQVMMNLCANAAHAMSQHGGRLEVKLTAMQVEEDFALKHPGLKQGPHLRLEVRDTGHGIPPGTIDRIFDPFFTTKPPGEGTGLGLAVVHGIVTSHEGAITVESQVGKGTCFEIFLPCVSTRMATAGTRESKAPAGHGEHILMVDDEPALTLLGRRILERMGYKVTTAQGSVAALELFRAEAVNFDLVITDQTMPQMTGVELAKAMLQIRPEMPILLMTGYNAQVNQDLARRVGIREVLMKPATAQTLGEVVRRLVLKKSTE